MIVYIVGFIWFAIRLIKTNAFNAFLATFGAPPVPKTLLPWLALALGALGSGLEAYTAGTPLAEFGPALWEGMLAGAAALATEETAVTGLAKLSPRLGAWLGKRVE